MSPITSTLILDSQNHKGSIDERIFSGFLEHLGRAVYGGVYQPGHEKSNREGFRLDVIEKLKPLGFPLIRWPGGNYVSAWRWEDTIGPVKDRPKRADYAWHSIESNAFGLHEFMSWCREMSTSPIMTINLGTKGAQEAADLVEYCNLKAGTHLSDLRVKHGAKAPFDIKTWCLGNEMDGPWQAGFGPAESYAWKARQAGHLMKQIDNSIEVIAAGSSGYGGPTWMDWDRQVLEIGGDTFDYIAAHRYATALDGDRERFLAEGDLIDEMLKSYRGLLSFIEGRSKGNHQPKIAFDEWNVWYRERSNKGGWEEAPRLLEEHYDFSDALVVAQFLNSFIRNADIVKIGCLAQIANVIAPILVEDRGVLLQSIYHPIARIRAHAKGNSLIPLLKTREIPAGKQGLSQALDISAVHDLATNQLSLHIVNRSASSESLELVLRDLTPSQWKGELLSHFDLAAKNTWENPQAIKPIPYQGTSESTRIEVPAYSFLSLTSVVSPKK